MNFVHLIIVSALIVVLSGCANQQPQTDGVSLPNETGSLKQDLQDSGVHSYPENNYFLNPDVQSFVDSMVSKHQYDRQLLVHAFSSIEKREQVISKSNNQPEVITPYYEYSERFIEPYRIQKGVEFAKRNMPWLLRAESQYGVDWPVMVALLGVETAYGRITGNRDVFTSLTTLSFDYPRRGTYFQSELEAYLLLARRENWQVGTTLGSYSGALGMVQFMPSNYLKLAVDYDSSGDIELWKSEVDAIGSIANYLRHHGWQRDKLAYISASIPPDLDISEWMNKGRRPSKSMTEWVALGIIPTQFVNSDAGLIGLRTGENEVSYWLAFENFFAVMDYNPSRRYAMSVLALAERIEAGVRE